MIWIDAVVRILVGGAAFAALYVAWFVYEDEERNLQSKIEDWWLQFDDVRRSIVSFQAAFAVVVAERTNEVLGRLFGPVLWAKDSIATAASLTLACYFLWSVLFHMKLEDGVIAVICFASGVAPLASPRLRLFPRAIMWIFSAFAVLFLLLFFVLLGMSLFQGIVPPGFSSFRDPAANTVLGTIAVSAGIAFTVFQVAVARRAMNWTIACKSEWPIVMGMFFAAIIPVGMLVTLLTTTPHEKLSLDVITIQSALFWGVLIVVLVCAISIALWLLFAGIASVMLLHRIVWPLASRLLYSLSRYQIVQKKTALNAIGATLWGIALGTQGWQTILKHFGIV